MNPVGLGKNNHGAGENQQQFTEKKIQEPREWTVSGSRRLTVLS
jgi:hypothetical protein